MNNSRKLKITGLSIIFILSLSSPVSLLLFGNSEAEDSYKKQMDQFYYINHELSKLPQDSPEVLSIKEDAKALEKEVEKHYQDEATITWKDWYTPAFLLIVLILYSKDTITIKTRAAHS